MIIIEGPDLAGKTQFCAELLKRLPEPWYYEHLSRPDDGFPGYDALMNNYVIRDRFHISAPIYGLARGEDPQLSLTHDEHRRVNRMLVARPSVIVVLLPSAAAIKARWRDGEMYRLDQVLHARDLYERYCNGALKGYVPIVDWVIDTSTFDGIEEWYSKVINLRNGRG
jgi:thymidylate kinase